MKTKPNSIKILLLVVFFTFSMTSVEGQIWKKLKDKAAKKVEKKIDKSADKLLDKTLSENKKKEGKKVYEFTGSVTIEMTAKNEEKVSYEVLFDKSNEEIICMYMNNGDSGQIYNVISPKKIIAFINASGMKIKKTSSSKEFMQFDQTDKIPSKDDLKKTGKVKSILGYTCYEYSYSNDGGTISTWVTKENFPIKASYAPMLGMVKKGVIDGFVLELHTKAVNGEEATIRVIKVDKNKKVSINSSEYKSMF